MSTANVWIVKRDACYLDANGRNRFSQHFATRFGSRHAAEAFATRWGGRVLRLVPPLRVETRSASR